MLFISSSLSSIHRRGLPVLQCEHDKQLWLPSKGSPLPIYLHWPTRGRKHLYSRESISPNNVRHWNADLVIWGPRLQPLQVRQKTSATGRRGPCRRDPWRTWIANQYLWFHHSIHGGFETWFLQKTWCLFMLLLHKVDKWLESSMQSDLHVGMRFSIWSVDLQVAICNFAFFKHCF